MVILSKQSGMTLKLRSGLSVLMHQKPKKANGSPDNHTGKKATKFLAKLVLNKTVEVKGYGVDRYNRILAVIFINDTNINLELVRAGLAEFYRGRPPKFFNVAPYRKAEKEAKNADRGIWSLGDGYISPKEWRRMLKK